MSVTVALLDEISHIAAVEIHSAEAARETAFAIERLLVEHNPASLGQLSHELCDKIVDRLCHIRDAGLIERYLSLAELAARSLPNRQRVLFDALMLLLGQEEVDRQLISFINIAKQTPDLLPSVRLAYGHALLKTGACRLAAGEIDVSNSLGNASLAALDDELQTRLLRSMLKASTFLRSEQTTLSLLAEILTAHAGRCAPDDFYGMIAEVGFFNKYDIAADSRRLLGLALPKVRHRLSPVQRAIGFMYLSVNWLPELAGEFIEAETDGALFRQPIFWKAYFLYARMGGNRVVNLAELDVCNFGKDELQRGEIQARAHHATSRNDGPNIRGMRVFVGMFGQFRNGEALERLGAYFMADANRHGAELTMAMATWDKTGGRKASDHGGLEIFFAGLPRALLPLVSKNIASVAALRHHLPSLYAALTVSSREKPLDAATIKDTYKFLDRVDVANEDNFEREVRAEMAIGGMQPVYFNQFKMYDRIAALRSLKGEEDYDLCVVIRNDLRMLGDSSLIGLASHGSTISDPSLLFLDWDPFALYVEGVGDRFFVGSESAVDNLFDCYDALCGEVPRWNAGRPSRLAGHEILGAHLYRRSVTVQPVQHINFEIDRGQALSIAEVAAAIFRDADSSAVAASLRVQVEALMLSAV